MPDAWTKIKILLRWNLSVMVTLWANDGSVAVIDRGMATLKLCMEFCDLELELSGCNVRWLPYQVVYTIVTTIHRFH